MTGIANLVLLGTVAEPLEEKTTKAGKLWLKLLLEIRTYRRGGDGETGQQESTLVPVNLFSRIAETAKECLKVGDAVMSRSGR